MHAVPETSCLDCPHLHRSGSRTADEKDQLIFFAAGRNVFHGDAAGYRADDSVTLIIAFDVSASGS